jgi:hypothetical protein
LLHCSAAQVFFLNFARADLQLQHVDRAHEVTDRHRGAALEGAAGAFMAASIRRLPREALETARIEALSFS